MRSQPPQAGAHEDPKTVAYFDEKVHDYSVERLEFVAEHMRALVRPGSSILDEDLPARIGRRFDFAVLAAVLHHLIGPTRRASKGLAESALRQALALLEPGGHLFVVEPIVYPPVAMDALF